MTSSNPSPTDPHPPTHSLALPQLLPQLPKCSNCDLHQTENIKNPGIPTIPHTPIDPTKPALLLLGQNPGFNEDVAATPFVGRSGVTMKAAYIDAPRLPSLATIYLSNSCRCLSFKNEIPKKRQLKACSLYLAHDLHAISKVHPCLTVLCLGAVATTTLYALGGMKNISLTRSFSEQGTPLHIPPPSSSPQSPAPTTTSNSTSTTSNNNDQKASETSTSPTQVTTFSTFHPAACLREPKLLYAVQDHLNLLRGSLTNEDPSPTKPEIRTFGLQWSTSPNPSSPPGTQE